MQRDREKIWIGIMDTAQCAKENWRARGERAGRVRCAVVPGGEMYGSGGIDSASRSRRYDGPRVMSACAALRQRFGGNAHTERPVGQWARKHRAPGAFHSYSS